MPLHARRAIVDAAVGALGDLVTNEVVTAVKAGRQAPMPIATAPYLLVYGRQERSEPLTIAARRRKLDRMLTLTVEIVTSSEDDNDEQADAIAVEVEVALAGDPTLGGAAKDLWISETSIDASADGEARAGRAGLQFTVTYHTQADTPDVDQLNFTVARNSQYFPLL